MSSIKTRYISLDEFNLYYGCFLPNNVYKKSNPNDENDIKYFIFDNDNNVYDCKKITNKEDKVYYFVNTAPMPKSCLY